MIPPRLLVLTDRHQCAAAGRSLLVTLAAVLDSVPLGVLTDVPIDLVVREKDLPRVERGRLAVALMELARPRGGRVLVASDSALAHRVGADGVHLSSSDPLPSLPLGLVGRSCHSAAELAAAEHEGADYATFSPVLPSSSKPDYGPPLGMSGLARGVTARRIPVLALGGVGPADVHDCLAAGAAGVAVMGAIMAAADPAAATEGIRSALGHPGIATRQEARPA